MARAPPSQRLAAVPEDADATLQWGLVDFLGKYHKHAIASDFPVPGSAVSRDELREAQYKAHIEGIRDRVNGIQARKGESVQEKVRHETFALKALIQKRVGSTLDRVGATLEEIDREVEAFDAGMLREIEGVAEGAEGLGARAGALEDAACLAHGLALDHAHNHAFVIAKFLRFQRLSHALQGGFSEFD